MRRTFLFIFLLVFGGACSNRTSGEPISVTPDNLEMSSAVEVENNAQVTLTLAVEEYNLGHYRSLVAQFEQEQPEISIRLVSTSDITSPDEDPTRAKATSFDLFPYSQENQGPSPYLLDLRPLLALDAQFATDDFHPGLLPGTETLLLVVPTSVAYRLIYYDKSTFDAANLPYPELEWTTEDFLSSALALTVRENGEIAQWGYVPGRLNRSPLLSTQLTAPLSAIESSRLSDPDVATAVTWMSDLFIKHGVSPWLDSYKPVDQRIGNDELSNQTLIANGMAAMWDSTHFLYDETNSSVGITAIPHGPNGLAAEPNISGFAISSGTRNPDAAWKLASFLSRQRPPVEPGLPTSVTIPARRSVAIATNFWEQLPPELATVLQYTVENSKPSRLVAPTAQLLLSGLVSHIDDNVPIANLFEQDNTAVDNSPSDVEPITIVVESEQEVAEDATQITFTSYYFFYDQHRLLAEEFEEMNPSIVVNIKRPGDNGIASYEQLLERNTDCFMGSAISLLNDDFRAAVLPIGPLLDVDSTLHLNDFYPAQSRYFLIENELLALPAFANVRLMGYNRDLFQKANVEEPALDWTLADFLEITQQLTSGSGEEKQYGYAEGFRTLTYTGLAVFEVDYVDESGGIPTFDFDAAAGMLIWYTDLIQLHQVQSPQTGDGSIDFPLTMDLIRDRQAAMWPYGLSRPDFDDEGRGVDFEVGVVPYPLGLTGARGDITPYVQGFYIMSHSPYREACWKWITFLVRRFEAGWVGNSLPAHIETAESPAFTSAVGEDVATATRAYMTYGTYSSQIKEPEWFFPGRLWLNRVYLDVINGRTDVTTGLVDAEIKFSQYRQCLIEQNAFDSIHEQISCALSVDPTLRSDPELPTGN